jgi:hypothetical protein
MSSSPSQYSVSFVEVGLPAGTDWFVTLNGNCEESSRNFMSFDAGEPGTYQYTVSNVPGYSVSPQAGSLDVGPNFPQSNVVYYLMFLRNPTEFTLWNPNADFYGFKNFESAFNYLVVHNGFFGNCYGISSTAVLYYNHYELDDTTQPYLPLQIPEPSDVSGLLLPTDSFSTLNDVSFAIMLHQLFDPANPITKTLFLTSSSSQFSRLQTDLSENHPVVLAMAFCSGIPLSCSTGHAVVAWGLGKLSNGNYSIAVSDPNTALSPAIASYNPSTSSFYFNNAGISFNTFQVISPDLMNGNWWLIQGLGWLRNNVTIPVNSGIQPGYNVILADKKVTVKVPVIGSMDYFSSMGDSQTFINQIPGSVGVEEGDVQAYGLPWNVPFTVVDPTGEPSSVLVM